MITTVDYCSRTGYRLPSEAEWEFAARAGTTTSYSWGQDPALVERYAWIYVNSPAGHRPVGTRSPNSSGLFDMHGNVSEWTQDLYSESRMSGPDSETPVSYDEDATRTIRGGSSASLVQLVRTANRTPLHSRSEISVHNGFRIARTIK